ncbi:peroxidasin-like isoform X2 [Gordionus sp. m RMFG-2023]|uniref:peroxidasin-like isoform X2 n=1 Tax=Gordionus sp. m RMFG-2023 TaxID=3053472 RepID=UPI0031FE043C
MSPYQTDLCPCNITFRTIDGSCNNPFNAEWGQAATAHLRFLEADYDDGISKIRTSVIDGGKLPNVRDISNSILGQFMDRDAPQLSVLTTIWGQFIDHDMTKTMLASKPDGNGMDCCDEDIDSQLCDHINTTQDSFFHSFNVKCLGFTRSQSMDDQKASEQVNEMTSFLDASPIYGVTEQRIKNLRTFEKGMMKSTLPIKRTGMKKSILPLLDDEEACADQATNSKGQCVLAGDDRFAEQISLTLMHIILLRQHNVIAEKLASLNLKWNDERIFQETRFGHSMITTNYDCLDKNFNGFKSIPPIPLRTVFLANFFYHNPPTSIFINSNTVNIADCLLRGLVSKPAKIVDQILSEEVRQHLFQSTTQSFGIDLGSMNIMRGRDHGLQSYVNFRKLCQLSTPRTFDDLINIIPNNSIDAFKLLYKSTLDLDLFPVGLAEFPLKGSLLGPTFTCLLAKQFKALRSGDSYWFENDIPKALFTLEQLLEIRKVTLAKLVCGNADDMPEIQARPLMTIHPNWNPLLSCSFFPQMDFNAWKEN